MKQQEVFKKIGAIIKEIKDQYDYLSEDESSINDLELELFVANAHFLTDHTEILRKLNKQNQQAAEPAPKPEMKEEPKTATIKLTPTPPVFEKFVQPPVQEENLHIPFEPVETPETFAAPVIEPEAAETPAAEANLPAVTPEKEEQPHERSFFEPVVHQREVELPPATEDYELPPHPERHPEKHEIPLSVRFDLNRRMDEDATPVPNVDMSDEGSDRETYSYIRQEPEVIRHELNIDEADLDEEIEDEAPAPSVTPGPVPQYTAPIPIHTPEPPAPPVYETPKPVEPAPEKPVYEAPKPVEAVQERPVYHQPSEQAETEEKVLTINQRMSAQMGQQTQSPLNTQKITDLKSAITLNDKLMFVKDLFNGYSLAYSEAIEILNRFNNFDEAERFLKVNYYQKNNWESKPGTVEKFHELLRRRFA